MNIELKYGDHVVALASLPEVTVAALLQRGFSHVMGNEQASKVVSKIKSAVAEAKGEGAKASDVTTPEVKAYREANEAQVASWEEEFQKAALVAMSEGTLGQGRGTAGPKPTKAEAMARTIAVEEITEVLKANGLTMPRGENKVAFANGAAYTREELIERRLASHGERIRKEAEKRLAAAVKVAGGSGLEDL